MSARATLLGVAVLGSQSSCLVPNWLYGESQGDTSPSTTTAATTAPTTTSETSTSSTATTETTAATATTAFTSSSVTTDTASTTDGPVADCWGRAPNDWDEIVEILDLQLGTRPRSARLSPDGLSLYYIAESGDTARPFVAERPSRDDLFVTGTLLAALPGAPAVDYPVFRRDPQDAPELILSVAFPGDLHVFTGPDLSTDTPLASLNHPDPLIQDTYASTSEDGSRLIFVRNDGPLNADMGNTTFRLYEATRPANAPAGAPFSAPAVIPMTYVDPPDPQVYPPQALCSTLAPDGRRLFFGSTHPNALTPDALADAVGIHFAERPDLASPFSPAERLDLFHLTGWETCPNAVTRDGCELAFHRFVLGAPPSEADTYHLYIARRTP